MIKGVFSSNKEPTVKLRCPNCEHSLYASTNVRFCPICGDFVSKEHFLNVDVHEIDASLNEDERVSCVCATCEEKLEVFASEKEESEDIYCIYCGSPQIITCDENKMNESEEEEEERKDKKIITPEDIDKPKKEEKERETEREEEPINKEELVSSLTAVMINEPVKAWVFFSNGDPIFKISEDNVSLEAKQIFETKEFPEIIKSLIKDKSFSEVISEFQAKVFDNKTFINDQDLDILAFKQFQTNYIPKFLDALNLAVRGAVKGVYPELLAELKACFFDELVGLGISESLAVEAIENAFEGGSNEVFSAIINKAVELMNKPEEIFAEIKSTIETAGVVRTPIKSIEEIERKELKDRLVAGSVPIVNEEPPTVFSGDNLVDDIRNRIRLSRR